MIEPMSLREKSAWITLATVFASFGVYFGAIASGVVSAHGHDTGLLLLTCVGVLVVLQCGLHAFAAAAAPQDAHAPRDEREQQIQHRSHTVGYYVLMACVLGLAIPGHMHGLNRVDLLNFALLALVVAALAVSVAQIAMFRRGA